MELKDFIKSAITQIAESVEELNLEFEDKKVVVNPTSANGIRDIPMIVTHAKSYNITNIDFDLSVVAESNEGNSGKVGVLASVIGIGISSSEAKTQHSESKLKFSLPVMLPSKTPYKD